MRHHQDDLPEPLDGSLDDDSQGIVAVERWGRDGADGGIGGGGVGGGGIGAASEERGLACVVRLRGERRLRFRERQDAIGAAMWPSAIAAARHLLLRSPPARPTMGIIASSTGADARPRRPRALEVSSNDVSHQVCLP